MNESRVTWKYPLEGLELVVKVPATSNVVHFAEQHGVLTVWLDRPVNSDGLHFEERHWSVRGTGDPTSEGTWTHRGTALVSGGAFVFHLYEWNLG